MLELLKKNIVDKSREVIIKTNYCFGNFKNEVIWVISDGRSGSTWLSNLINYEKRFRYMFEPFHPHFINEMKSYNYFPYLNPNKDYAEFYNFAKKVFSGEFVHPRVDSGNHNLLFKGLLIKDVFSNLFAKWVDVRFPKVKKILLLRHPCAVAYSKEKLRHWKWMTEPVEFLANRELLNDYLTPFIDVIKSAKTFFEKQIVIWAVVNYVPLRQFKEGHIHLVFYENIYSDFESEINKLFAYVFDKQPNKQANFSLNDKLFYQFNKPSKVSRKDKTASGSENVLENWRKHVGSNDIKRMLEILKEFGLDKIYSEDTMPNAEAACHFINM